MKTLRRILLFGLTLVLILGLSACTENNTAEESSSESTPATEAEDFSNRVPTEAAGNILVAYFSHTGNTEEAAQVIADYTAGDLAEIQRTADYGDLEAEAEAEILEGALPEITVSVENVADYDTIFVGYPIWWDEAPAMIASFLADNEFAGKRIVPFCTSSSDEIDNSLHIFEEHSSDAVIEPGLTANDLDEIAPWLVELEIIE